MTSRGRGRTESSATTQLAAEIEFLTGRLPGSFLAMPELPLSFRDIPDRVEGILRHPDLVPFLSILERHNRSPKIIPGRRLPAPGPHFLLAPHLFQVLMSVEDRRTLRVKLPAFDQPAAEVRMHLQTVSARCRSLANLIRKGPQPHVALAAESGLNEALRVLMPLTAVIEASGPERQVVPIAILLERGAAWFEALTQQVVPRSKQNRRPAAKASEAYADERRSRAAEFLVGVFRRALGHPYHAHVATIATIVSGIETDADFVKKVEARQGKPNKHRRGN